MERVRVSYLIKNADDKNLYVLNDKSVTFNSFDEAMFFVRKIRATKGLVGNPMIETGV
jgi:hypothetical protein